MADFLQGLMGTFGAGPQDDSGLGDLLTNEQRQRIAQQQQMAMAMALLKAGGPSPTRTSLGQALGSAWEAGQTARQGAQTNAINTMLTRQKIEEMKRDADLRKRLEGVFTPTAAPADAGPAQVTPEMAIKAPGMPAGPTVERAQLIGQPVERPTAPSQKSIHAAQYRQAASIVGGSDPVKAKAYLDAAEKLEPQEEWSTTPQYGQSASGTPISFVLSKTGGMKLLDVQQSPDFTYTDTGGAVRVTDKRTGKLVEVIPKTMTPGEAASNQIARGNLGVAQGNLGVARERLNFERTKELSPQLVEGQWVYKPTMNAPQGAVVPVKGFEGKAPEGFSKAMTGVAELRGGLDNLKGLVNQYGTNAFSVLPTEAKTRLASAHTNLLMGAKNAFELGVLNGPDLDLIQRTIPDPNYFRGTNEAYMAALDEAGKYLENKMSALQTGYGRKPASAPIALSNPPIPGISLDLISAERERRKNQR